MTRTKGSFNKCTKHRRYIFVDNNIMYAMLDSTDNYDNPLNFDESMSFLQYQLEQGLGTEEKEGHVHIQGYIVFKEPVSLLVLFKEYPGVHFEPCKGSHEQNLIYTSKDSTAIIGPYSWGSYKEPSQGSRSDLESFKNAAADPEAVWEDLSEQFSGVVERMPHFAFKTFLKSRKPQQTAIDTIWTHDQSFRSDPDVHVVDNLHYPGLLYAGQSKIAIVNFQPTDVDSSVTRNLNEMVSGWCNRLPQMYGKYTHAVFDTVIIHSQYDPKSFLFAYNKKEPWIVAMIQSIA